MSRSTELQRTSETTGSLALGETVSNAIGLLRGATAFSRSSTTAVGLPVVRAVTAAEATATEEREIDRPDGWPKALKCCVVGVRWQDSQSTSAGWDGFPVGYEIAAAIPAETVDMARTYYRAYRDLCAPLDETGLTHALLRLRDRTVRRAEDGVDWQITLENWLDSLAPYPADMVLWALGYWGNVERFWPTWAEIKSLLDRRVAQRRACMDALKSIGERGQVATRSAAE